MDAFLKISYEAIALRELYSDVRKGFVEGGIRREIILGIEEVRNTGKEKEYKLVRLGSSGNSVQVFLRVYNPDYR